jgi:pilus assembly protein Flp/PilA
MTAPGLETMQKLAERFVRRLARDTQGQDLIEYALLLGFVTIAAWAFFPEDIIPSVSAIFAKFNGYMSQVN